MSIHAVLSSRNLLEKSFSQSFNQLTTNSIIVPWERGLHVPVDATPFPQDRAERISINAFGLGGSNAHVILDSARSLGLGTPAAGTPADEQAAAPRPRLLVYTANNAESTKAGAEQHAQFLSENPEALADTAYTLAVRREHLAWRTFAVADGTQVPHFLPPSKLPSSKPAQDVVFVFTGQGAQWAAMGSNLLSAYASARDDVAQMDDALSKLEPGVAPGWTIASKIHCDPLI